MLVENQKVEVRWVSANKKWFIDKGYEFTKMWDYFYVNAEDLMPTSKYRVKVICDFCEKEYLCIFADYYSSISNNEKIACYDCRNHKTIATYKNIFAKNNFDKIKSRCDELGYTLLSNIDDLSSVHNHIEFICPTHGHRKMPILTFLNGSECQMCANKKNWVNRMQSIKDCLEDEINQYNGNVLLNAEDYVNSKVKNLKIVCGKCKDVFVIDKASYIKNAKRNADYCCPSCNIEATRERMLKSKDDVEEYINSINGNILLNKEDYIGNDVVNLKIKCGSCGEVFTTSFVSYQYGKTMCGVCASSISRGELAIKNFCDLYNIKYKHQHWFNDCRDINPLPFDFYFIDYNILCEYQGEQHYKAIDFFGGEEGFQKRVFHDKLKKEYCINNNIVLIEIPYYQFDNIEDILIEKLGLYKPDENCA